MAIQWQRWQAGKMNRNICSIKAGKELTGSLQPLHMHVFKCMRDYKQTFEMDWFLRDGPATLPKGLLQITLQPIFLYFIKQFKIFCLSHWSTIISTPRKLFKTSFARCGLLFCSTICQSRQTILPKHPLAFPPSLQVGLVYD